jgi:hypothetical protein
MRNLCAGVIGLAACATILGAELGDDAAEDMLRPAREALKRVEERKTAVAAAQKAAGEAAEKRKRERALLWEEYRKVKHPRILITPERLAVIRKEIQVQGSHAQLVYDAIKNRYRGELDSAWLKRQEWLDTSQRNKRWPAQVFRDLALLSMVAENPAEQRRFAEASARFLPSAGAFLSLHFTGNLGTPVGISPLSMAYDWGYNQFTEKERAKYESVLDACLDMYGEGDATDEDLEERRRGAGYNHKGVKGGPDVLVRLAAGAERNSRGYERAARFLSIYFDGVGGELGAHSEGLAYTEYPMSTALPAALAAAELGDRRVVAAAEKHAFWLLNMYAQTFMTSFERKFVMYGVDHQSNANQGFATCVFGLCPKEMLPYYLWFYDRHMGWLCGAEPELRFDSHRNTTGLALLLYPYGVEARDPTPVLPKGVVDRKHGYCFFRNRWQDENDIQVALLAGRISGGGGWNQYEHLSLRLMGYDTRFFGGPGKERTPENYTTLLVDGALYGERVPEMEKTPEGRDGRLVAFETTPDGGYAIVDKDKSGPRAGIGNAIRHLLVRYSDPAANTAILSTLDSIESTEEHTYTWQANLGAETMPDAASGAAEEGSEPESRKDSGLQLPDTVGQDVRGTTDDGVVLDAAAGKQAEPAGRRGKPAPAPAAAKARPSDDGIVSTQGKESGRPFFLLKGRKGYVKGWVVHPADAAVTTGDPLQIAVKGTDAKIWVVMYVGADEPVVAAVKGSGMDAVLEVGGHELSYDGERLRVRK